LIQRNGNIYIVMIQRQQLNITCGTDVVLHDRLEFDGEVFDPSLSTDIVANLVNSLGKRTALEYEIADEELIIQVPWVDGRNAGCYGLEVKGKCNGKTWATYADSLIRYTRATVEGASVVEVSSDWYDITQVVSYRYSDSPLDEVDATIDDNYGEPTVTPTYEHNKLTLDFKNLRGNGIASVEQTTESLDPEGVNETTITQDNGNTTAVRVRNGKSIVGPQGPQGASAVFDPQTGNILATLENTTGLNDANAMTQKAVTEALGNVGSSFISIPSASKDGIQYDGDGGKISTKSSYRITYVRVHKGEVIRVTGTSSTTANPKYGFSAEEPAIGVDNTGAGIFTGVNSIDFVWVAQQDGFFGISRWNTYFTDVQFRILNSSVRSLEDIYEDRTDIHIDRNGSAVVGETSNRIVHVVKVKAGDRVDSYIKLSSSHYIVQAFCATYPEAGTVVSDRTYVDATSKGNHYTAASDGYVILGHIKSYQQNCIITRNGVDLKLADVNGDLTLPTSAYVRRTVNAAKVAVDQDIESIIAPVYNYYSVIGKYVNRTPSLVSNTSWAVSVLIPVTVGDTFKYKCPSDIHAGTITPQVAGLYYDDGTLKSYSAMENNREITVTSDTTKYVSLSVRLSDADSFALLVNNIEVWRGIKVDNNIDYKIAANTSPTDIYSKNKDKIQILRGASLRGNRFQFLIATDVHKDWQALRNAVDFANQCEYINALFCLGDYPELYGGQGTFDAFNQVVGTCEKPVFSVIGNHDAGYGVSLHMVKSTDVLYNNLIAPYVGNLAEGEYEEGKPYYYHDFTDFNIRAIFLYEFDEPITIASNSNWEPVTYDSSNPLWVASHAYAVDDLVNIDMYTGNSFRCKSAHTSSTDSGLRTVGERGYRYIGETQMNWLVSTLASTPQDYSVIIVTHIPASQGYEEYQYDKKFCVKRGTPSSFNMMNGDYIGQLVDAFNEGESGSIAVSYKGTFSSKPGFTINYDFSEKNSGTKFMCFIAGHTHSDGITKNSYGLWSIIARYTDSTTRQYATSDVPTSDDNSDITRDALTVVALDTVNNAALLTRVGTTATSEGYLRDYERIDLNE